MTPSLAKNLADHVRWLDSDAHSLFHEFNNEGTISVVRLDNLIKMAQNTKKALKSQRLWETL